MEQLTTRLRRLAVAVAATALAFSVASASVSAVADAGRSSTTVQHNTTVLAWSDWTS